MKPPHSAPPAACAGATVSADIAVPEHERELRFYARVLTTGKAPHWRDDLMNDQGTPIIGLGERVPEYQQLPLQWMPHIQVADVAASVQRALALGGQELMSDKPESGASQWAVLLDPNGAAFGLIAVVPAEAIPSTPDPAQATGHIAWLDLVVADASESESGPTRLARTRDFYREVIGWKVQAEEGDSSSATGSTSIMLDAQGNPAASIRSTTADIPPVWLIYLTVDDLTESARQVEEHGGKLLHTTHNDQGELTHAVIEDPVGACLALMA